MALAVKFLFRIHVFWAYQKCPDGAGLLSGYYCWFNEAGPMGV